MTYIAIAVYIFLAGMSFGFFLCDRFEAKAEKPIGVIILLIAAVVWPIPALAAGIAAHKELTRRKRGED